MLSFIKLLLLICLQIYQIQKKGKKCKPKQVIKAYNNRLVVRHIVNGYQTIPKRKEITVASLPVDAALFLVALATLLTILAGIIPARGAAKCNPVKALRAE